MSHFAVVVIGKNPEEQLAPYNENIKVSPYKDSDVDEDEKQRFIDTYTKIENGRNWGVQDDLTAHLCFCRFRIRHRFI